MLKKTRDRLPTVYTGGVLALLPLVFHDGFFDISRVKCAFFLLWTLLCCGIYLISGKVRFTRRHVPLIVFIAVSALSTLLSSDPTSSLWGSRGRMNGFIFLVCLSLGAWLASQNRNRLWSVYCFFGAGCIVSIWGTLQFFGMDILGFYENMRPAQTEQFLSTIGNIDLLGAFLCLLLPMAAGAFLYSEKARVLSACAVFFSSLALLPCRAEGGTMALICAAFLSLHAGTKKGFFAVFLMLSALLLSCALTKLFGGFSLAGSSFWYAEKYWYLLIPVLLFCLAGAKQTTETSGRCISKTVSAVFIAGILFVLGLFCYFTFIDREAPLTAICKYLRFTDTWGSYRGGVWTRCVQLYGQLPLKEKLIGVGPDSLMQPLSDAFGSEIAAFSGMRFDNAHCVPLQYLLTTGALGLLSIAAAAILPLISLLKNRDGIARAAGFGCLTYLICALFTVNTPAVSPLFWVLLYGFGGDENARA